MDTTERRRARTAEERRKDILEAAIRLFRDRGFDATPVQDIADAAGVAAGTMYLYFRSKEHLLHEIHEEFHRGLEERFGGIGLELLARMQRGERVGPREVIDAMWDAAMAYNLDQRRVWEVMCRYAPRLGPEEARELETMHSRFMAEMFRRGVELGFVQTSDPEMTGYLLAAVNLAVGQAVAFGDPPDLDRLVAHAKELYSRMLAPDPDPAPPAA